jgi:xanthosine utilization system XapX-like protein
MKFEARSVALLSVAAAIVSAVTLFVVSTADAAPASGKAALVGVLGLAVGFSAISVVKASIAPLGPFAIFVYSHTVIFVLRPGYNAIAQGGRNIFDSTDTGTPMVSAGLLGALGFVCVSLGYCYSARRERAGASRDRRIRSRLVEPQSWPSMSADQERSLVALSVLVFFGGAALYFQYIRHVGGLRSFLALNAGRSAELTQVLAGSSGYEISGLLLTTGTSLLILTLGLVRNRRTLVFIGTVFLVIAEVPQLMTGSRSQFVPIALAILIVVTATRPGLITLPRAVLFGVPAFILLFVAPRILRSEVTATNTAVDALKESFSAQGILDGFFGGLDTAMIDAFALQIAAQSSGQLQLAGGSTYLAAMASFVPRGLWPDKPLAVDTILNQTLFPATAAKSIGFSFGIYSEPFFNWGLLGIVLVAVPFGLVLGKLGRMLSDSRSILTLVAVAMFSGQVFTLVRGSISFDLQRFLIPLVPLLVVWVIAATFARTREGTTRKRVRQDAFAGREV